MKRASDAELIAAARRSDAAAFSELVRRHERAVQALARSLLGDWAEAEDMAQESFLRAFRNLDLLVDPSRFRAWLLRITFGVCVDWLRTFRPELYRSSEFFRDGELPEPASDAPIPLEHVERLELSARVESALAQLPPKYRVPFTLFHVDGLSHAKVSRALGVPVGTTRSLVSRARRKLAVALESYAEEMSQEKSGMDELFEEQPASRGRLLHVLNGDCTADVLRQSDIPGTLAVWADVLHEGPAPAGLSPERWREVRARFIAESGYAAYEDALALHAEWDRGLDTFREHHEVVLWFEHDLFDQLILARHLDWFTGQALGETKLSLICIGEFEGVEPFHGLGQLSPDQLASLLETRERVTARQLELGRQVWRAFTAEQPDALQRLLERDTSALPFMAGAMRRFLEEYPWVGDGLPRTERQILRALEHAPATPVHLFRAVQRQEERVFMGDSTFWKRVRDLAAGDFPLLEVDAGEAREQLPDGTVRITEHGRRVLAGRDDAVTLNGLDRWLGGVHLVGRDIPWRWDPGAGRLRRRG
ncbi:MAG: RNA polymerase sigma factor [Gemmatimonadaceae bacterium]